MRTQETTQAERTGGGLGIGAAESTKEPEPKSQACLASESGRDGGGMSRPGLWTT